MEFDWLDVHFDLKEVTPKEVEESFEDPFAIKLIPAGENDGDYGTTEARYFCMGKTVRNRCILSVFWTDGKKFRVIFSREMTDEEKNFYDRKNAEYI